MTVKLLNFSVICLWNKIEIYYIIEELSSTTNITITLSHIFYKVIIFFTWTSLLFNAYREKSINKIRKNIVSKCCSDFLKKKNFTSLDIAMLHSL